MNVHRRNDEGENSSITNINIPFIFQRPANMEAEEQNRECVDRLEDTEPQTETGRTIHIQLYMNGNPVECEIEVRKIV